MDKKVAVWFLVMFHFCLEAFQIRVPVKLMSGALFR